jgi:hypothetical protein
MGRARAVAALAGDVDLGIGGVERVGGEVVAAHEVGRVAVGAHRVPVLEPPGPVQLVPRRDDLVGIEVEPALAAVLRGPRVPGGGERLEAAAGQGDEILLERGHAEGEQHLEVLEAAVRPVGADDEVAVPFRKNVVVTPSFSKVASSKSPRTVFALGVLHGERRGASPPTARSRPRGRRRRCRRRHRSRRQGVGAVSAPESGASSRPAVTSSTGTRVRRRGSRATEGGGCTRWRRSRRADPSLAGEGWRAGRCGRIIEAFGGDQGQRFRGSRHDLALDDPRLHCTGHVEELWLQIRRNRRGCSMTDMTMIRFASRAGALVLGALLRRSGRRSPRRIRCRRGTRAPTSQAIVDFVTAVTTAGRADFVAVEDRVATFDNDGTLWVEQPFYVQLAFALRRGQGDGAASIRSGRTPSPSSRCSPATSRGGARLGQGRPREDHRRHPCGHDDRPVRGDRRRLDRDGEEPEDRAAQHRRHLHADGRGDRLPQGQRLRRLHRLRRRHRVHAAVDARRPTASRRRTSSARRSSSSTRSPTPARC